MKQHHHELLHRASPRRAHQHDLGVLLALGAMVFGGTYSPLAKGLTSQLSPPTLLLISEGLTALFLAMTIGMRPLAKAVAAMSRREFLVACLIGLLNSAVAPMLWFTGLTRTTAINASLLTGADVIFTLLFSYWFLKERINRLQALGAAIVLAGVAIIHTGGSVFPLSLHDGDFLILGGVATFALGAVLFKRYLTRVSAEVAIFLRNVVGMSLVLSVGTLVFRHGFVAEFAAFPTSGVPLLLSFAFFARYVHLMLFYEALDRMPASELGLIENAMPLFGVAFAIVLLGEQLQFFHTIAALLIVFGLVLEQFSAKDWRGFVRRTVTLRLWQET